jgi:m7GpppX diphosphatase
MTRPSSPASLEALEKFTLERILNDDPVTHALTLLGNIPAPNTEEGRVTAIIRIEKTALSPEDAPRFFGPSGLVKKAELEESTDIVCQKESLNFDRMSDHVCFAPCSQYTWLFGWFADERDRDVKINIICPATEVHIRKVNHRSHLGLLSHYCPEKSIPSRSKSWSTKPRSYTKNMSSLTLQLFLHQERSGKLPSS